MPLSPLAAETDASIAARYEALIRISNSIRALKGTEDLFHALAEELRQVVPFDAVVQYDHAANRLNWHTGPACRPLKRSQFDLVDREGTLAIFVYREQKPVVIGAIEGETRFPASVAAMQEAGIQSACAVPLTTAHRRLGSLIIASVQPNAFSPEEVRFFTLVADQVALAMDDAISFQRLQLLLDLTNRVVSSLNLRDVLREISAQVRHVMDCHGVGIELPSPEDGKLLIYVLDLGDSSAPIEEGYEVRADTPLTRAFQTGEPVVLSGEAIHQHVLLSQARIQSLVHVPMRARSRIVGVLSLGTHGENAFSQDDLPFLAQVANQVAIAIENARAYGEVSDQKQKLTLEKLYLEDEIRSERGFEDIVGGSEALHRVLEQIKTVAPTDSTVLIYGETGTGKELIARAVHNLSARKPGGFVKLNCAAIPTGLLESEMFGHEKGAFTGAIMQRIGRFELAHRGTIFLDEIGEIPLELQPKLLRVLQEREFERLGSSRTLRTDARLVAATNRDLEALVKEQKFRPDLYYRLNVFPVRVPALRERPEDIPLLVRHFVQRFSRQLGKTIDAIPADIMNALVRYPWPGNIRELQNVIERAAILATGPVLTVRSEDLRFQAEAPAPSPTSGTAATEDSVPSMPGRRMRDVMNEAVRRQILTALEKSNWKVGGPDGAAARLGMKRSTLQSRMHRLGIQISKSGGMMR